MADTITIPSPSVFLRASPEPVPQPEQVLGDEQNKAAPIKRRNTTTRKKSTASTCKPRRDGAAVAKPKQSKSRNGRLKPHLIAGGSMCLFLVLSKNNFQVVSLAKPNA